MPSNLPFGTTKFTANVERERLVTDALINGERAVKIMLRASAPSPKSSEAGAGQAAVRGNL